jgi:hypothetical protein
MRVAQLGQDLVRDVARALGDEIDPDALGADQAHHLRHLVHQGLRGLVEQQVGLVEEEDQPGLVLVADLGQGLEQFRQQPEQEGGIEPGRIDQPVGGQHVHRAAPPGVLAHQVGQVQGRFAEERLAALLFQHQEPAQDGPHRCRGDVAVSGAQFGRAFGDEIQQRPQVLEVEDQQVLVVRHPEGEIEHRFLGVVEFQQPGQQQGAHLGHRGAHRMALFPEQVPEDGGEAGKADVVQADGTGPLGQEGLGLARQGDARQVALRVGDEDRYPGGGKAFRQKPQRDRLAGSGGARDQSVAVRLSQIQDPIRLALAQMDMHVASSPMERLSGVAEPLARAFAIGGNVRPVTEFSSNSSKIGGVGGIRREGVMRNVKELARSTLDAMIGCPRQGDCLARRFVEKRLLDSIDETDEGGIWHWTTHAVGEMDACDLDCPAKVPVVRLVETLHGMLKR